MTLEKIIYWKGIIMQRIILKKRLHYLLLLIIFFLCISSLTILGIETNAEDNQLKWLSYSQGLTKSKVENIPALVYFYSDNCGYCRKIENETFSNEEIKKLMSQNFSLIKIDSNSTNLVLVNGEEITERSLSGTVYQVRGNPTIWFLDEDNKKIAALPGFVEPDIFKNVLIYIKDNYYREYSFPEYMEKVVNR